MSAAPATTARWASATSIDPDTRRAAAEAADRAAHELGEGPVDLALAFFSAAHAAAAERAAAVLRERLVPRTLLGVSAHGVVSSEHEIEGKPAFTVLAGRLPGVEVRPFVLVPESWAEAASDAAEFARLAPGVAGAELVLLAGDPFSLDVERVLAGVNRHAQGVRVVGGMASAAPRPGGNALILNDWVASEGGVAVALAGAVRVDVIVSQGCRPVGPPLEATRVRGNLLLELDGEPALERAERVLQELPEAERGRLEHGLYVGRRAGGLPDPQPAGRRPRTRRDRGRRPDRRARARAAPRARRLDGARRPRAPALAPGVRRARRSGAAVRLQQPRRGALRPARR